MNVLIFLGAPGSGKGTVAEILAGTVDGFRTVSSGALLRDAVKSRTEAGVAAEATIARGELVPDQLIAAMIGDYLKGLPDDSSMIALDGFPRTVAQAEMLESILAANKARLLQAAFLDVPRDVLLFRLSGRRLCPKCGAGYHISTLPPKVAGMCDTCNVELITRADDQPATIENRLKVYQQQTVPLKAFYEDKGLLTRFDAAGEAGDVARAIAGDLSKWRTAQA